MCAVLTISKAGSTCGRCSNVLLEFGEFLFYRCWRDPSAKPLKRFKGFILAVMSDQPVRCFGDLRIKLCKYSKYLMYCYVFLITYKPKCHYSDTRNCQTYQGSITPCSQRSNQVHQTRSGNHCDVREGQQHSSNRRMTYLSDIGQNWRFHEAHSETEQYSSNKDFVDLGGKVEHRPGDYVRNVNQQHCFLASNRFGYPARGNGSDRLSKEYQTA